MLKTHYILLILLLQGTDYALNFLFLVIPTKCIIFPYYLLCFYGYNLLTIRKELLIITQS